ncbi:MAG TPA: 50S ribosomal protein L15 [Candidatus Acidoferrales bacterium]|nr:50S ribosomal protein L15 [Candidatus Acidoferrales bacterium]
MGLSNLKPPRGSRKQKVRVGRGMGSKLGRTSGRGQKGQKSRSGYKRRRGFEGGQMPLHRRMPKRGFHNPTRKEFSVVNLVSLNAFNAGETVTPELLRSRGLVRRANDSIKILGDGDLKIAITVQAHAFSGPARGKISAAGGKVEILS